MGQTGPCAPVAFTALIVGINWLLPPASGRVRAAAVVAVRGLRGEDQPAWIGSRAHVRRIGVPGRVSADHRRRRVVVRAEGALPGLERCAGTPVAVVVRA